jgi:SAM-dependent methyltransferase
MADESPASSGSGSDPAYTHGHHESVLRAHRWRTAENSAGYLLPHLEPGMSLLDVGCGPGSITMDFARILAPALVVGVDSSGEITDQAREAADKAGVDARFGVANAYRLPFPDGYFDIVHAHQLMQHLEDPVRALREMARVAGPGGLVAARDADFAGMLWYPRLPELDDWLALYDRVARSNGGEPNAARHMVGWSHEAGFEPAGLTASASAWCYAGPDAPWWGESWADRMLKSSVADRAVELGLADRAELERIAAGWLRWSTDPDAIFTVTSVEILYRVPGTKG